MLLLADAYAQEKTYPSHVQAMSGSGPKVVDLLDEQRVVRHLEHHRNEQDKTMCRSVPARQI
ncbi:hypothetical protein B0H10DRAFT_2041208 [Mycena sp. CBHHK59/15]|nr:hypothetical protein B0H10DRAFT_2041208 [Mycena sp. CBHHK59/15]